MGSKYSRRVVITGIGVVSPVGIGVDEFWKNSLAGVSGVDRSPILVKADCPWKIAGEVKDFHPEEWLGRKDTRHMDRFTHFGLVGAYMAIKDAGINLEKENRERIGVAIGTAYAGWEFGANEYETYKARGFKAMSAYTGIAMFTGACGGQISLHLGLQAPSITVATGCDCSSSAIAYAAETIIAGQVDVMVTGGAEAPIQPIVVAAVGTSRALSNRNLEPAQASRPFDLKRDGFVMGEGSGILIIEELEHARKRGARIYAELAGWGSTCDAFHMCQPSPTGEQAVRAIELALCRAGVPAEGVDYINAHGTSTPMGDAAETRVLKKAFGEAAYQIPVSSSKSQVGHMQGACGGVELATCCLAIRDGAIPPTINYEYADPECDLDWVPNISRRRRVDTAVSTSLGFGGRNTALLVRRYTNGNGNGSGKPVAPVTHNLDLPPARGKT